MAEPLSIAASVIAVLQLSSKVIGYINGTKGGKTTRRRLREGVQSCESTVKRLKDDAEDLEDGDTWKKTLKALEEPDAPLHQLRITLGLIATKLEPKKGFAAVVSTLIWPFSEKEVVDM